MLLKIKYNNDNKKVIVAMKNNSRNSRNTQTVSEWAAVWILLEWRISDVFQIDDEQYNLAALIAYRRYQHAAEKSRAYKQTARLAKNHRANSLTPLFSSPTPLSASLPSFRFLTHHSRSILLFFGSPNKSNL